jgi:metal-responsive CopG/Arc/MetJ family transcriptional regulator
MGRKPLVPGKPKTERVSLVLAEDELQSVDQWRREQKDIPSRSEAIRRLIAKGLKAK